MKNESATSKLLIISFTALGFAISVIAIAILQSRDFSYVAGGSALFAVTAIVLATMLYLKRNRGHGDEADGAGNEAEVGFVVNTFHELVAQLKEKEEELERLRANAEDKAVSMEVYNDNILQSVPSGVISVDNGGTIQSVNHAAQCILGLEREAVIGKAFESVFRDPLRALAARDRTAVREECQYETNNRRAIWLGVTTSHLKDSSGHRIGRIFVFTDLSDIRSLREQVELKHRLSELGEMSAGISHELRNSMSVITGYAKLLGKRVDEKNQATVAAIEEEIRSMDRIISELLAFARPSVLSTEEIDVCQLVKDAAQVVVDTHSSLRVTFPSEQRCRAHADAVLLKQALSNLFMNAAEAMPDGGDITVQVQEKNGQAEIQIGDTGQGIAEDVIEKIFLPFFTTKEHGTGFGLALVQKIIISHGGTITVESREGAGTLFRVMLPAVEQHVQEATAAEKG